MSAVKLNWFFVFSHSGLGFGFLTTDLRFLLSKILLLLSPLLFFRSVCKCHKQKSVCCLASSLTATSGEFMGWNIQLGHPWTLYPRKLSEIINICYFNLLSLWVFYWYLGKTEIRCVCLVCHLNLDDLILFNGYLLLYYLDLLPFT